MHINLLMNKQKLVLSSVLIMLAVGLLALNSSILQNANAVICQTGQFKGFNVKSSEVCNLVIPQLNSATVYKVTKDVLHIPGQTTIIAIAECDTGDFALTGRYAYAGPVGANTIPIGDGPITQSAWRTVFGFPGNGARLVVEAFCFDNLPFRPQTFTNTGLNSSELTAAQQK